MLPEQAAGLDALRGLAPGAVHAALSQQLAPLITRDTSAADALGLLAVSPADDAALAIPGARTAGPHVGIGVCPGYSWPGRRHRRLLPAAVGVCARNCAGQNITAVRLERPDRRITARKLVAKTAAQCSFGGCAGRWAYAHPPDVGARPFAPRAR